MTGEINEITREWFVKVQQAPAAWETHALELFRYQYRQLPIYRQFADRLGRGIQQVHCLSDIPFLPISFFKTHALVSAPQEGMPWFESSGTTGMQTSRHYVRDMGVYEASFRHGFQQFYGDPTEWCILALLPSYLERNHSSLVYMASDLIKKSGHPHSGFYLHDQEKLAATLSALEASKQKTLLLGVTFALIDFAAAHPMPLQHTTIMETGGMKGRKEELTRTAVHQILQTAFQVDTIHSEYGMTELLSQAYSKESGRFHTPGWMRVLLRDEDDPLSIQVHPDKPRHGAINVIDLANIHSCAFIATEDAGRLYPDGSFEILGRLDQSDLRGCSLLAL